MEEEMGKDTEVLEGEEVGEAIGLSRRNLLAL